jgi:hypothetical protein
VGQGAAALGSLATVEFSPHSGKISTIGGSGEPHTFALGAGA